MITFLEKLQEVVEKGPERIAVVDREGTRSTTYRQLMDASDRIAAFLLEKGIGAEKVVVIHCDRAMEYVAAHLGVMKAGAAWIGVEDMMGAERIKYITETCNASLIFDEKVFEEALKCEPLSPERYADPDPHQLAFIVFTSGSTGKPKGAAQEYGIYDQIMAGTKVMLKGVTFHFHYANIIPETFVGGIYITVGALQGGDTIHMLPLSMIRNPAALLDYFEKHRIDLSFMPPSLAGPLLASGRLHLFRLHVGGEIVSEVYTDRFSVQNIYGPTEFGYPTCIFDLDRSYVNTPIGCPVGDTQICLINEEGEAQQDEGILCIRLPYFRGYLHEGSGKDFIRIGDGRFFRTEDIASVDENGRYTILGRADDMVKINGNRIDPSEVEFALKKVLGVPEAAVCVHERDGVRFLCAYLACGQAPDPAEMEEKLKQYIPEYMIPSCYISMDRLPISQNGKVIRHELPEPEDRMIFAAYAAPRTETETNLCGAFEKALNVTGRRLGLDDDFFLLGGDSVRAMQTILEAGIPTLTVPLIYRERTVRRIVKALEAAAPEEKREEDFPALPLTAEQEYFLKQELCMPGRLLYNLPVVLSFKPDIDRERLKKAVADVFEAHPALLSVFRRTEEGWEQKFCPELNLEIPEEHACEEEMETLVREFVKPFSFDGQPLFRRRLVITPERTALVMDLHHLVCDGNSLRILCEDILNALAGSVPERDCYYDIVRENIIYRAGDAWKKDKAYFDKLCKAGGERIPRPDDRTDADRWSPAEESTGIHLQECLDRRLPFFSEEAEEAAGRLQLSPAAAYLTAAGITLAVCNDAKDLLFTWTWSGRGDTRTMRAAGLLLRDIPIALHLEDEDSLETVASEVRRQVREGVLRGKVSYFMEKPEEKLMCFLYQGGLRSSVAGEDLLDVELPVIPGFSTAEPLEIRVWEEGGAADLELGFNTGLYRRESMKTFADLYEMTCGMLFGVREHVLTIGEIREAAQKIKTEAEGKNEKEKKK